MAVDSFSLLALFGVTIIVGYIGYLFFDKTKIPDLIWLVLIGVIIGPIFNLVDRSVFLAISPFLASLALLVILFQAGIEMNFYQVIRNFSRSMLLALVGVALAIAAAAAVGFYIIGFDPITSLLLGAILSGISSEIVVTLVKRLGISQQSKTTLQLESILTDPITIVVSIVFLNIAAYGASISPLQSILSTFSVGAVLGLFVGLFWLFFMDRFKGRPFDYMLTIAVLFLMYVFIESTGGSGAIGALVFGIILGNGGTFSRMLKTRKHSGFDRLLRSFQAEVSFFIRAFFFVYLGIIVSINTMYIFYGIIVAAALVISRFVAVRIGTYGLEMTKLDKNVISSVVPRGLAPAALAQLAVVYGVPYADLLSDIVFVVIISTVIYTTIATWLLYGNRTPRKEHIEEIRSRGKAVKNARK